MKTCPGYEILFFSVNGGVKEHPNVGGY